MIWHLSGKAIVSSIEWQAIGVCQRFDVVAVQVLIDGTLVESGEN